MPLSSGARAVRNGERGENWIRDMLSRLGYLEAPASTIPSLAAYREALFPISGNFAVQVEVPLNASYMKPGRRARVDFVIIPRHGNTILLSNKYQESEGTADEKLEYEGQQLICTCIPSALVVIGSGFRKHILEETWERLRHFGKQLFLFRRMSSLDKWAEDGFPVPDEQKPGMTHSILFKKYCDANP